jgi:hypothetical protein
VGDSRSTCSGRLIFRLANAKGAPCDWTNLHGADGYGPSGAQPNNNNNNYYYYYAFPEL